MTTDYKKARRVVERLRQQGIMLPKKDEGDGKPNEEGLVAYLQHQWGQTIQIPPYRINQGGVDTVCAEPGWRVSITVLTGSTLDADALQGFVNEV